jgi:hypothetical protein
LVAKVAKVAKVAQADQQVADLALCLVRLKICLQVVKADQEWLLQQV